MPVFGPLFLSDEIQVSAGNTEATALPRDISLYRTYSYVVTNTSTNGAAQVSLRSNGIHRLNTTILAPQATIVLTPNAQLSYPVFDEVVEVTYIATAGAPNLRIRFTGQLKESFNRLPLAPFAWGNNASGQLGDSSTDNNRLRPVQTLKLSGVKAITGGNSFSLALLLDGTVWVWGSNTRGQIGDGTTSQRWVPKQIGGLSDIVAISAGDSHSLALRSDGAVFAWGLNTSGQLGDGTVTSPRTTPVQVLGVGGSGFLRNIAAIAAGDDFSVAVRSDGRVLAWGGNGNGQLGNNNASSGSPVPVEVVGLSGEGLLHDIVAVSSGDSHTLALVADGSVIAWGSNFDGQLGNNNAPTNSPVPVRVRDVGGVGLLDDVLALSAGEFHSLALRSDGTVLAWGNNSDGQLGNNNFPVNSPVPTEVLGVGGVGLLRDIVAIAAGQRHSAALGADGRVYTWGQNDEGQLGNGTTTGVAVPIIVGTISDVVRIGVGSFHTLAVVR